MRGARQLFSGCSANRLLVCGGRRSAPAAAEANTPITTGESSWHCRARRQRQSARGLIALTRARRLLERHHGGGVPSSDMAPGAHKKVQGGGQSQDGGVLRGPNQPYWICSSCCDGRNWACRIQCRTCHTDATSKVSKAARAARKAATAPSPKAPQQRAPEGSRSNGPPHSKLAEDLRRKLAAQNENIKKISAAKSAEAGAEVEDGDRDM